jgi:PAS domain S-box-containing protein
VVGELERQLKSLRQSAHLCHICNSPTEQLAVLVSFFRDGLARNERCVCASDPSLNDELIAALGAAGVDCDGARHRGAVRFLTHQETYLRTGSFQPHDMLVLIRELCDEALADGFTGLRGVGDMSWAISYDGDQLREYEALVTAALPGTPITLLCQYHRPRFKPAVLHGILRAHPQVILGEQVCPNQYYEPPDLLACPAGVDLPARRLDWMLGQLQQARAGERERERLVEQLHTETARLEAVVRHLPAGVLITEAPSGKIVLFNERLGQIGGRPAQHGESLPDYQHMPFFHPDGRPYPVEDWPLVRAMRGEQLENQEMVLHRADGGLTTISVNAAPIRDAVGDIIAAAVIVQDVTARKQVEEALRTSAERYRLLFERSLAAVYRSTPEGQLLDCNEAFAQILGYASRAEVISQQASNFYPTPTDREAFIAALRQTGTLTNHEMCMRRKNGLPTWVLINSSLLTDAVGRTTMEGTFVDISARKEAEEATLLSASRYRGLIEQLGEGVFLKDRDLRFVLANKAFCSGVGCEPAELVGRTAADFFPRALAEALEHDDRCVLEGERVEREHQITVENKPRLFRIVSTPVHDETGRTVGVLGIFWDVTEQRTLEAQLRQAQKMEAIGMMAGGIAHDFNNLLAVILGNIALSLGGLSESHPHRELLAAAERAGVQAAELTNRLLGFARQTILRTAPVQLNSCMEETTRLLERAIDPRIQLVVKPSSDLWTVEADPGQMNQVLMNLCINARDAMPEGGRLTLDAVNVVIDEDVARQHVAARRGEFVRLRVSDSGHGIPADIRARIFEPFFTTKSAGKGTGLGLAMVYGIVQQHQGWIECYSEVGTGTRFDVYLPRHTVLAAGAEVAAPEKRAPRGGRETILLADDEPMIRTLGRTILQRYGYRVLLAEDGVEAVETYRQSFADIDLVILDLTMPRLSGHDALRQMLQINPKVCVLLASGYSAEHISEGHGERIAGFLSKPYRPEKLAQTVREALDRAGNGAAK